MNEKIIKIPINQTDIKFQKNIIGIDLGQTLTKIAYIENTNELNLLTFSTQLQYKSINEILESKLQTFERFNFTGGRGYLYHKTFSNKIDSKLLNEFQTHAKGIESLYNLNKENSLPNSLIINIGTGTFFLLKKNGFNHLGGSALGGGFFMGFVKLLYNIDDFQQALMSAEKGNRYNIDLKVSDIYEPKDRRINLIFREFTAASFGKIKYDVKLSNINQEDIINSLICMMGENLGTIANLMAQNNDVNNLVFCGGFLKDNKILERIFSTICKINKKKAIFLKNSEFCGAIGALLS